MSAGGPLEHRYVTEDDPARNRVCRVCGHLFVQGEEEPGCPAHVDMDVLREHPGRPLTSATDVTSALVDLRKIWQEEE